MKIRFQNEAKALLGVVCLLVILCGATPLRAQKQDSPTMPFASIGAHGVNYAGPGRQSSFDLTGSTIHIGILVPTHGPQKADGEAILTAAKMAIQDASRKPLPDGRHLALSVADESVPPWGLLGDKIIHLIMRDKVVAIVTCADGVAAHLSEQIGNKIGIATLTLSGDDTATEINMPWIFRMGPSDIQQARVITQNIYQVRGYKRVLLVTGQKHDGQIARKEYIEEVHKLGAPSPVSLVINELRPDPSALLTLIKTKNPQAIVLWAEPENAKDLIRAIRSDGYHTPIYVSQKTAQIGSGLAFPMLNQGEAKGMAGMNIYSVDSRQSESSLRKHFVHRYQLATGTLPSPVAGEAYDAVRLVAQAVREAGPNRARVRDAIAAARNITGASGKIAFGSQGNNHAKIYLVRLQ